MCSFEPMLLEMSGPGNAAFFSACVCRLHGRQRGCPPSEPSWTLLLHPPWLVQQGRPGPQPLPSPGPSRVQLADRLGQLQLPNVLSRVWQADRLGQLLP